MFLNYLLILWRNTTRNRLYSLINILGLSVSMAASILLLEYAADELSYDQYHKDGNRIFRLTETFKSGGSLTTTAMTPYVLAELITHENPAVESYFRFDCNMDRMIVEAGEKKILEKGNIGFNDSTFFDFFSVKLLQGHPIVSLSGPNKMVISQNAARKYFENGKALGETLTLRNPFNGESFDVEITGIMENMPMNTHFYRDFLISMATSDLMFSKSERAESWDWTSVYGYIKLAPNHDISEVTNQMESFKKKHLPERFHSWMDFGVQAMPSIHLHSQLKDEMQANGDITYIYIFIIIAIFIIALAAINYMNLATARAIKRAREVGMRKVMGAQKKQLVFQFLLESLSFTFLAFIIAGFIVEVSMPIFNQLYGKDLAISYLNNTTFIGYFFCLALFVGILSGSYPAFIMSRYQPISVLKGNLSNSGKGSLALRKGLVIFQFSISIALIISTIIIFTQWEFLRNKKLGLNTTQIINIEVNNQAVRENFRVFKQEVSTLPNIIAVTAMNKKLTNRFNNYWNFYYEGFDEKISMPYGAVEGDFFKTFEVEMLTGRSFGDYAIDSASSIIVNEAAAKLLGKDPYEIIGTRLKFYDDYNPEIVGVVKNFHFESLYNEILPMFYYHSKSNYGNIAIKFKGGDLDATLAAIEKSLKKLSPITEFQYEFMDDEITRAYESEARFFKVFSIFASLAIVIACLGIFGLATFTTVQRRKEIGIRKVLGASASTITLLLSNDFTKLVLIANLFACPVTWYLMENWLQDFAYHVDISWWVFALSTFLSLAIALFTVIFQSLKAALGNPINALKNE